MDSNYKNGLVFSDGQTTGDIIYKRTQEFAKRQKHTRAEVKSMIGAAIKQIDFSQIKAIQFCRYRFKWDRRNRRGDKFLCVNCHHGVEHADFNASKK